MLIQPGTIIYSAPTLQDPHFDRAVIVITEYNEKGAVGFVVNNPFPRSLNELVEFSDAVPFALYAGGPVDTEHLFVLHRRADLVTGDKYLFSNTCMSDNFQQIVKHINQGDIQNNDIKLFIGYCGWDGGELEAEIKEGSWAIAAIDEDIIYSDDKDCWKKLQYGK